MLLLTRTPTLTGAALGGAIVRPGVSSMSILQSPLNLVTMVVIRPTLAPPVDDAPRQMPPTLLTTLHIAPNVG